MIDYNVLYTLIFSMVAGLLAGKLGHDTAVKNNNDRWKNLTIWDWVEDAMWGLLGGIIGLGLTNNLLLIPLYAFGASKWIPKMADKISE